MSFEHTTYASAFSCRCLAMITVIALSGFIQACDTNKGTSVQSNIVTAGPVSDYDLGDSVIPFPNDLLFDGSTTGTLNIPVDDPGNLADPKVAMNGVDGFSTMAPISTGFSTALDAASITGDSVRVFEVVKTGGPSGPPSSPVTSIVRRLTFGVDYIATVSSVDSSGSTLVVVPLKPLAPKTSYAVVITDDLQGADGKPVAPSASYLLTRGTDALVVSPPSSPISNDDILVGSLKAPSDATQTDIDAAYAAAAKLEGLRAGVVNPSETALLADAGNSDITSNDIVLHWTFTTQAIDDVLQATRTQNRGLMAAAGFADAPGGPVDSPLGAATIKLGFLQVPYYLTASDTSTSPSNDPTALGSFWQGPGNTHMSYLAMNVTPVTTSTETIPMMVSIPKSAGNCAAGMPAGGWPVVIYQHGITTNRATMLAVADAMAGACMAVVAIDLPMHGITGNETDGTAAFKDTVNGERTFDLDLVTQDATTGSITAAVPDGIIDSSGRHFINLQNLLNSRDNFRQAVSDLFALTWAIESGVVTDGANTMDASRIYFLGHSLGAMVGATFVALESNVRDAAFAFGGSGIAKILDGSSSFGPEIAAGLESAAGVVKGTPEYEAFFAAAQTVIDSGDPGNYATSAASGRGILFFEIVGDGATNPSDLTVPNTVPDANDTSNTVAAPLAGTEPLISLMGLTQSNATIPGDGSTDLLVTTKFTEGDHGSLLSPASSAAATTEIQTEAANFFGSDGTALIINNAAVLQAP